MRLDPRSLFPQGVLMRISKGLLALLLVTGLVGAGVFAYDAARPRVHPIKVADARRYADVGPPRTPADRRADLFGHARAIDGDTLLISDVEVDLWTIDAPELPQTCEKDGQAWACGEAARAHLEQLINGRQVACRPEGPPPQDGRWLGICFVTDVPCQGAAGHCQTALGSLNLAQVSDGWAADVEGQFSDSQADAQGQKAGLWAGAAP